MSDPLKLSRDKVRRFVRYFLSIEEPTVFLHQTLTFSPPIQDAKLAKARLKKLLEHSIFRGAVYALEDQQSKGLHFHLLLYFYDDPPLPVPPGKMREYMAGRIFDAWNEINGGKLTRRANRLNEHRPDLRSVQYLSKEAMRTGARAEGQHNWWGKWNTSQLRFREDGPDEATVKEWMKKLYPPPLPLAPWDRWTARRFARYKRDFLAVSLCGEDEWARHKQQETGSKAPVSDEECRKFFQSRARRMKLKQ